MAKKGDKPGEEPRADAPEVQQARPAAPRYRIKGRVISVVHPVIGIVTKDHIEGPQGETFIKAFKHLDAKNKGDWFSKNIEEVK